MDDFETQLASNRNAIERFVRFRIQRQADAEDVLQEVYLTEYQKYAQLQNKAESVGVTCRIPLLLYRTGIFKNALVPE